MLATINHKKTANLAILDGGPSLEILIPPCSHQAPASDAPLQGAARQPGSVTSCRANVGVTVLVAVKQGRVDKAPTPCQHGQIGGEDSSR